MKQGKPKITGYQAKAKKDHQTWLAENWKPTYFKYSFNLEGKLYSLWGWLLLSLIILGAFFAIRAEERVIYNQSHALDALKTAEESHVLFSDPIEIKPRQNLKITATSPVNNSWAWVGGDFINETTGQVYEFDLPIEYYFGVEGGESWTEGSQTAELMLSTLPAGRYTLRLEFQWENYSSPKSITVNVQQGVMTMWYWWVACLLISIIPIGKFLAEEQS